MTKDNTLFDPTFDGIIALILSFIVLAYAFLTFQFGETPFNVALTAGLLGIFGGLLDAFGYIDMADYVDFQSLALSDFMSGSESDSKKGGREKAEVPSKTPPVKPKKKYELYYERAQKRCEHCKESVDQPHVHHIVARADGGTNTDSNLMILCPNCHTKADAGLLSKHRLRFRMREQNEKWDERKQSESPTE